MDYKLCTMDQELYAIKCLGIGIFAFLLGNDFRSSERWEANSSIETALLYDPQYHLRFWKRPF